MWRTVYLTAFVVLSGIAGFLYYSQTRLIPVVVATANLKVGAQVEESDLSMRRVHAASVPSGTLTRTDQAIGRFVSFPVLQGHFVDARQLGPARTAEILQNGLPVPNGARIISLPIQPAAAVGGLLKAGDLVDVIAVPNTVKADDTGTPAIIGRRVLVVGLRSEQGTELDPKNAGRGSALTSSKAGSILLAITEPDETRYSAALAHSTFFFALATD